jgi:RNA polymerase sigma-70 factor (ECF subfamily)
LEGLVEESELIACAQSGDRDAFRSLVEGYSDVAERTARVLLSNRADAEDAAQEAWLDAWKGMPRFQVERAFRPWLLAIVANRCRMKARQRDLADVPYSDEIGKELREPEPDDGYDEELDRAIGTLDADQQRVLALRFYADLQLDEIAELMDTPIGTVKSRLHRAIAALRTELTQKESDAKDKGVTGWTQ